MKFLTTEEDLNFDNANQALYFYSSWMPYHKKMMVMISKIEEKYKDIQFFGIDVDHLPGMCKRFNIESIPTVIIMIENGKEYKRINGLVLTSAFKSAFADIYNS